ncbi:DoxX family protein [Sphingomonas bacterium]|uniref:DoxX family protein n=1 Tax=Sphingomonas bacterium TaxID=1895847 RepID=UPI0026162125|nr:DoxX family protein [Sphingomonas bacterium]MDB5677930.1 DoxX family protein [Sphingomonas bacterium]
MMAGDGRRTAGGSDLACRFLLSVIFLSTGIPALLSPASFATGLRQMGVPLPGFSAAATIALTIIGPLVLIFDIKRLGWAASFALAAFTALTIPFGHAFWRFGEPQRMEEMRIAIEHVSLIGGLMLAGLSSLRPGRALPSSRQR